MSFPFSFTNSLGPAITPDPPPESGDAVLRTDNTYSLRTDGSKILRYFSVAFNGLLRTDGSYLLRTDGSRRLRVS